MKEIHTKKELKKAVRNKEERFVVVGELAEKLQIIKILSKVGAKTLAVLLAGIAFTPSTGGASNLVAGAVAAGSGVDTAVVIIAASFGVALIISILKGYDVSFKANAITKEVIAEFKRK